jgi:hypothetical protein
VLALGAFTISARAEEPTADDVKALVERAAAHVRLVGHARAFADFDRPDGGFVDGELYVFCSDADGTMVAHGGNPKLVGGNLRDVRDPDGNLPGIAMQRIGNIQGGGWLEYRWPNPLTKRIELKVAYVLKVDDHTLCGSGYYKDTPP